MSKVMFSLPDNLIERMKAMIPAGERSQLLAEMLEKEVENRENQLYQNALLLERNEGLRAEMKVWDESYGADGLDDV